MEHEDGSADICECDCHEPLLLQRAPAVLEGAPPSHPLPFDHGKFRVAEEPPGTDPALPWQLGYCVECREATWAKNPRSVERGEVICESDYYNLVSENYERIAAQRKRIAYRVVDPFVR